MKEKEMQELQEMFDRQGAHLTRTQTKLTETTDTLSKATDQLRVTEDTLTQTKESLNEHKFLLHEHEETEVKFHEEANTVLTTLDGSISDIGGLFAKIDRKVRLKTAIRASFLEKGSRDLAFFSIAQDNLELNNLAHWEQFRNQILSRVRAAESTVSSFIQDETSRYAKLHSTIDAFVDKKNSELATVLQKLTQLEASTREHFDSAAHRAKTHVQDAQVRMDAIQHSDAEFDEQFSSNMQSFVGDFKAAIHNLQSSMVVHKSELEQWASSRRERMDVAMQGLKSFAAVQTEKLGDIRGRVSEASKSQVRTLEAHREALDSFVVQQREDNQRLQTDLMCRIGQIVETYFQQHQQTTTNVVRSITSSLQDSIVETGVQRDEIAVVVDNAVTCVPEMCSRQSELVPGNLTRAFPSFFLQRYCLVCFQEHRDSRRGQSRRRQPRFAGRFVCELD